MINYEIMVWEKLFGWKIEKDRNILRVAHRISPRVCEILFRNTKSVSYLRTPPPSLQLKYSIVWQTEILNPVICTTELLFKNRSLSRIKTSAVFFARWFALSFNHFLALNLTEDQYYMICTVVFIVWFLKVISTNFSKLSIFWIDYKLKYFKWGNCPFKYINKEIYEINLFFCLMGFTFTSSTNH